LLDFWTEADDVCDEQDLYNRLGRSPQPGIMLQSLIEIHEKQASLQSRLRSVEYQAEPLVPTSKEELEEKINEFMKSDYIMAMRKSKEINLRPLVLSMTADPANDTNSILMHLQSLPGASGRPDDVLEALGFDSVLFRYTRTKIHLDE